MFIVSLQDYLGIRNVWEVVFYFQTRDPAIHVRSLRPCLNIDQFGVLSFNPVAQIIFFPLFNFLVNYFFEVLYRKFKVFFIVIDFPRGPFLLRLIGGVGSRIVAL